MMFSEYVYSQKLTCTYMSRDKHLTCAAESGAGVYTQLTSQMYWNRKEIYTLHSVYLFHSCKCSMRYRS